MHKNDDCFDAAVIGGSYAGLSAALQLARARQRVLVIDGGQRRNRFAHASHGFLGQDGVASAVIPARGREQLLAYPNVTWIDGVVAAAVRADNVFELSLADGVTRTAHKLVLATGVVDELPQIDGLAERWGRSVFHCPYCHGYELQQGRIGVLTLSAASLHQALMLPDWGTATMFTSGAWTPDAAQSTLLAARGVRIETTPVHAVVDNATLLLEDGRRLTMDGLFVASRTRMASPLAQQLGCAFEDGPMGPFIQTDPMKQTSVPDVFACGDAARMAGNVAMAVGDGAMAGVAAHRALMGL